MKLSGIIATALAASVAAAVKFDIQVVGEGPYNDKYIVPQTYGDEGNQVLAMSSDSPNDGIEFDEASTTLRTTLDGQTKYGFLLPWSSTMPKEISFQDMPITDQQSTLINDGGYLNVDGVSGNWYVCDDDNGGLLQWADSDNDGCYKASLKLVEH